MRSCKAAGGTGFSGGRVPRWARARSCSSLMGNLITALLLLQSPSPLASSSSAVASTFDNLVFSRPHSFLNSSMLL